MKRKWTGFGKQNRRGRIGLCMGLVLLFCMLGFSRALAAVLELPSALTQIADEAFMNDTAITSVVIPDGTTSIGARAFAGCTGLTGVPRIPASVKEIGAQAFYGCEGLSGVLTLPTGIKVAEDAFAGCTNLTVKYAGEMPAEYFEYTISNNSVAITGYKGPVGQVNISIPSMIEGILVTGIADRAFYDRNDLLGTLLIPDSVTSIGEYAFYNCSGFTGDLIIPDSVTNIKGFAFGWCSGFAGDLKIPDSVASIGEYAFEHCWRVAGNLKIPDSVTSIGEYAFSYCGFTGNLVIPDSVTSIGEGAFRSCGFTGDLRIPDSVTSIDRVTFAGCSGFTGNLTIPEGVTSIGEQAFSSCKFDSVYVPKSVKEIGFEAFTNMNGNIIIMGNDVNLAQDYHYINSVRIYADRISVLGSINDEILTRPIISCNILAFYSDDESGLEEYAKKYNIIVEKLTAPSDIPLQNGQFIMTPPYEPVWAQNTYSVQLFLLPHDFEGTTVKVESSNPEVIEVVTPEYVVPEGFEEWPKVSVRAVSEGTATITATLANGYSDNCEITVGSGTAVAENCVVAGIEGLPTTILYDPEEKTYSQTEFKATFGIANVDHTSQYDGLVVELPDGPVEIESIMVQLSANLSFSKGTPDSSITFAYQPESDLPGHVCELETPVVLSLGERWEYSLPVYILEPAKDSSLPFKATIVAFGKDGQTYQYVHTISKNYPKDPVASSIQTITISEAVKIANQADTASDDETEQIYAEFVNQFKSGKLNASVINELQLQYMTGSDQKKLGDRIISLLNTWVTTLCIDQFAAEIGKVNCFESEMSIELKTGKYPGTYTFTLGGLGASSAGTVYVSVRSETNPYLKNDMTLVGYAHADFEGFSDQLTKYVEKQQEQLLKYVFKGVYNEFYRDLFTDHSFEDVYAALQKAKKWYSWLTNGKNDWEEIKKEVAKDAPNLLLRLAGVEETFESITKGFGFDYIKEFMKSFEDTGFNTSIKILNMQ